MIEPILKARREGTIAFIRYDNLINKEKNDEHKSNKWLLEKLPQVEGKLQKEKTKYKIESEQIGHSQGKGYMYLLQRKRKLRFRRKLSFRGKPMS